ncbi:MAG: beta-ketoacyl-[acyl-carrier-protein] synthase family protein [Bacteroidales bacterium]|nr:beta-ketoacyl-[acyl-carrier-protein] synthase family protein [Bacteroidales bacterium]
MKNRVAITGMGVVSPIGSTVADFAKSLRIGDSGISYSQELEAKNFVCKVAGIPQPIRYNDLIDKFLPEFGDKSIRYALSAAIDAWQDAGFVLPDLLANATNDKLAVVVGSTCAGYDYFARMKSLVDEGRTKKLGSWFVVNTMHSGPAAFLSSLLSASCMTESVSSACASGTEAIARAYDLVSNGIADVVVAGGCDPDSPYVWAGFDAMRLLCRNGNDSPQSASRPLSEKASGFVPSAGAGILVVENMDHAQSRGSKIYAEIVGACVNSGGQRHGGSMTAPNSQKVVECIQNAVKMAGINPTDVSYINGHLTGTMADPLEVANWCRALNLKDDFPYINSTKSLIGHALGAAGAIETIATVLQMHQGFVHVSKNCMPLHAEIANIYDSAKIPQQTVDNVRIEYATKASFGFGDVNACLVLKKV